MKVLKHPSCTDKENFEKEIIDGFFSSPKKISSKFFYDEEGSKLFEEITKLEEYYPTNTEKEILKNIAREDGLNFDNVDIIELGSGDSAKISLLLGHVPKNSFGGIKYFPVDISESAVKESIADLTAKFPELKTEGIVADFMRCVSELPKNKNRKRLFCLFGSTIGNLGHKERDGFLDAISSEMVKGDAFLLGLDMVKDKNLLERAYNDDKNVTASFNKNILNSVNKLINGNFDTDTFQHIAFYNDKKNRVEMHLKAKKDIEVLFQTGSFKGSIFVKNGETIHTENSYKFTLRDIHEFSSKTKLKIRNIFTDKNGWFSLVHYVK